MQRHDSSILPFKDSMRPSVVFLSCPLRASLDVLGRKWTLLILYTIGFMNANRFNEMLVYMPELTRGVLARRLGQLEKAGYLARRTRGRKRPSVVWVMTEKGNDTIPVITQLIAHSSKWRATELFEDGVPKSLAQIFPAQVANEIFEILV